jgi:hypothetical protein
MSALVMVLFLICVLAIREPATAPPGLASTMSDATRPRLRTVRDEGLALVIFMPRTLTPAAEIALGPRLTQLETTAKAAKSRPVGGLIAHPCPSVGSWSRRCR